MLTIVAAMEQELVRLRKELGRRAGAPGPELPSGVELQVIGVGRLAVETAVRSLTQRQGVNGERSPSPERLLLLGFAGGVDPAIGAGTLVLSSRYYRQEPAGPAHTLLSPGEGAGDYLAPDPEMFRQGAQAATGAGEAWINTDSLTVDHLVATPEAKQAIRLRNPVGIVEMEDYWVAAAARKAGVPFLSARVVLDAADQALPGYLLRLSRSRTRAAVTVAAMPWRIPALLGLARRLPLAQKALTRFATAFLGQVTVAEGVLPRLEPPSSAMPAGSGGSLLG
ncbi:MAG: hypothetical protein QF659_08305 [Dehalococcoidia bacterium]|nr:hypothetical protein [Dehalococcoidia bacterium]